MAQAIPNSVIHKIRNALGNVVFYERGGQLYTRARVSPSQAPTTARTRVRANLAAISAAWKSTLTEAQRQAWRTASLTAPQNPQRNNRGTRSGWTYYQQVNLTRLNLSLAQTATPPALQDTDPPTAFSVNTLDAGTPSILLDVAGAEGANTHLIVYASPNRPPGYFTANGKTGQIQVFPPGAARPLDVTAAWQAKYGTLTPGDRINFQVASANAIDGRLTARQYATAIVQTGDTTPLGTINGGFSSADIPPASPNALDDEFNGSSLDAKWTWENQGGATAEESLGDLTFTLPNSATLAARYIYQATPTPPWEFTAKLHANPTPGANYYWISLIIDDANLKPILAGWFYNSPVRLSVREFNNLASAGTSLAEDVTIASILQPLYIRVATDGTTITWKFSGDGKSFRTFITLGYTSWFASGPTRIGIGGANQNATNPTVADWDWFRRTA